MTYIPIAECKNGGLYRIHSRNLRLGVFVEAQGGFIGIREKMGYEYLFTEYHWDTGAPYGTVQPVELLEECTITPIQETLHIVDSKTKRVVEFESKHQGGNGWFFKDTGESGDIMPESIENKDLFDWLEAKEKQYCV